MIGGGKKLIPCPYCAERIPADAARCDSCGNYLPSERDQRAVWNVGESGKGGKRSAIVLGAVLVVILAAFSARWLGILPAPEASGEPDDSPLVQRDLVEANPVSEAPAWSVMEGLNKTDLTPEVVLMKTHKDNPRAALIIRCVEHKTEAYVTTGTATENGAVRVRIGPSPAAQQKWKQSSDGEALFAPNAIAFARELAKAQTFALEFTPFRQPARSLSFDVSGLEFRLLKVAQACQW